MANGFEMMRRKGIVPVINIEKVEYAVPLAQALIDGGLPLIEVTLRSDTSLKSIEAIHKAFPDMPIAAGTVLSPELAKEAVDAGAGMIVAPGFQEKTVRWNVPYGSTAKRIKRSCCSSGGRWSFPPDLPSRFLKN